MEASEFDIRESGKEKEKDIEKALRPLCFDDFAGQNKIIANLRIFVQAAKMRGEALDHTLLHGPRDWERPPCQTSWPTSSAWASRSRLDPCSTNPATWPEY